MAGYNVKKTGSKLDSWDYYIAAGLHSIAEPFRVEKDAFLVNEKGEPAAEVKKGGSILVVSNEAKKINGKKSAAVAMDGSVLYLAIDAVQKRTTKLIEGGLRAQERQEQGIIKSINGLVAMKKRIAVKDEAGTDFEGVTGAEKNEGTNSYGKEPYVDIWITQGTKKIGISNKGETAPSVAGGGAAGLYRTDPAYLKKMLDAAYKAAIKAKWKLGEPPPSDIYVKIADRAFLKKVLRGTPEMGGPVDYFYIGKMDVEYTVKGSQITYTNGKFVKIEDYMKKYPTLYLRIRRRNTSQKFVNLVDPKTGLPVIFKGADGIARLVIETRSSGLVVNSF